MKRILILGTLVCAAGLTCRGAEIRLPGEGGTKPALGCEPFPSRLHAFVWRNWTAVPQARLAEVLKTEQENVAQIALSMGLVPQGTIPPEWVDKGFITLLRRNWHLLPYEQLMTLVGMSREKFYYALIECDGLFIKLGSLKPRCDPLLYALPSPEETAAAARIAGWLSEEGGAVWLAQPEEQRFAFIKTLSEPDPNLTIVTPESPSPFELRFIFSYFADYGDPLIDPDVTSYPEGLLQRLSAAGVNGVWVHTVLRTLAKDAAFPEFGEDCEKRITGLRALVARGKKYGIDVYLYISEPRAMPEAFFTARPERAEMRGVAGLCTSNAEVRRWMADALATVFTQVPGLGGVFTTTASTSPTSCASHGGWRRCPRCKDRTDAEIFTEVNAVVEEGVHRGNPDAKVIAWDWGWRGHGDAPDIVAMLPEKCWFMSVSEWALPIERGGVKSRVGEYAISAVGPGPRATRHWKLAKEGGHKTVAKVQVGATWEFSVIPYLPVLDLVAEHARNLAVAGVDSVMLSWSLGCYPSPNLEVFQAFTKDDTDIGPVLDRVAERHYGKVAAPLARQAWTAFSDGFREYPFNIGTLYSGPQHMGPANPFYLKPTGYAATMVGIPYDDLKKWVSIYPVETWIGQMEKVRDGFSRGCDLWEQLVLKTPNALRQEATRELGLFRAAELHFASCVNQARFVAARNMLRVATDTATRAACREKMRTAVNAELAITKQLLLLAKADSRIGYESSNQYFYIPQDLIEKIVCCRYVLAELDQAVDMVLDVWQARDVGALSLPGSTSYDTATGAFTLTASGGALRNDTNLDAFQFFYRPVKGDFTVDLLITNEHVTGRSALMIRNTLDARCPTVALYRNADREFGFHCRLNDSGQGNNVSGGSTVGERRQHVMRLVRKGNCFTPYLRRLPDGAWFSPAWVNGSFSNGVEVAMDEVVDVGVAVISTASGLPQSVRVEEITLGDQSGRKKLAVGTLDARADGITVGDRSGRKKLVIGTLGGVAE